jgi:starvation-inducible DNA-binding protein
MKEVAERLTEVLSDTFVMYFKAHSFHWNVEGPNFSEYHKFLGKLYKELFAAIDPIAEHIRALDEYAPKTLSSILAATKIQEQSEAYGFIQMVNELKENNDMVIISLYSAYQAAEDASELGLANFIQDRIDIHQKHGWMLRAFLK